MTTRNIRSILIFAVVLVAAVLVARYFSARSAPAEAAADHNHATAPASDSARAVMLSTEAARRIGVTYAPVQLGPLGRVVRTVAIVSYDETRLKSVTTRVDGWVDRLYVNFSGQAVQLGDPLFALYSPMLLPHSGLLRAAPRRCWRTPMRRSSRISESARRRLLYWEADEVRVIEESGEIQTIFGRR
jgi:hypothetical protein